MFESVKKFLKKIRRQRAIKNKYPVVPFNYSARGQKKLFQKRVNIFMVRDDQKYGVALADGSLVSIENRWVRKQLFREKKLFRIDRPKIAEKGN